MDWQLGREVGGGLEGCEGDWESGEAVGAGGCVNKVRFFRHPSAFSLVSGL